MNGSNARCATCGRSILKRTAEKYNGLCARCYQKPVVKPPDDFEMPDDLVRRIELRGEDPENYRKAAWRDGSDFVHQLLDTLDDAANEYSRWSPTLRKFAAECRRAIPTPVVESLTGPELAQYRLLHDKMSRFAESEDGRVTLSPRPHRLVVLSTSRVGLAAADELFGASGAVILEESERFRWFAQIHPADEQRFWWYSFAWWSIQIGLNDTEAERIREHPKFPGDSYWILDSGVQWGPLHGGGDRELWRWDGERAEFVEKCGSYSF